MIAAHPTTFATQRVGDVEVFYRTAGPADAPAVLLHGFPSAGHMFRDLIPELAGRFRVIAPDLPGFGQTRSPDGFPHTFDRLAAVVEGFTKALGLTSYALLRLRLRRPGRPAAGAGPSRAGDGDRVAERKRLRGGLERGMGAVARLLG